jgi:hypothetical protein
MVRNEAPRGIPAGRFLCIDFKLLQDSHATCDLILLSLVFGVYPRLPDNADPNFNLDDELTLLEQIWLEKTRPFGERGYNTDARIRQV